ncbi:MAG: CvpA family protein [Clostridiales Family XIII bacterium]|jgi:uncharacterized membrane protein required for colicin V production|nr:CvpA family protein [Clostridiales Family XIII bacterium]
MIFDILIAAIVIISMVMGCRTGFFLTVFHSIGWLVSIIAAILLYPAALGFIDARSGFPGDLYDSMTSRLRSNMSVRADDLLGDIPDSIIAPIEKTMRDMAVSLADGAASVCFSVIIFLCILLGIKLIVYILTKLVAKAPKKGLLSNMNALLGLLLGGIQGMIIVYVLLGAILPASLIIGKTANNLVEDTLFSSMFAREMYNNNPLLYMANYFLEL